MWCLRRPSPPALNEVFKVAFGDTVLAPELDSIELYRRGGTERIDRRGLYMVPSCSHRGEYLVDLERQYCECPDSRRGHVCKHVYAAMLYAAWLRRAARTVATSGAFDA